MHRNGDRITANCVNQTDDTLILNPVSGAGDHPPRIRREARKRGLEIRETKDSGDGRRLASEAITEGVSSIVVAGGDGTVNEVVYGIADASSFEDVDIAIIPTGTANLFARRLGITSIASGFELFDSGTTSRIDVGFAGKRPFLNTCLTGVVAQAETTAPSELKRRLGIFAYVVTTLKQFRQYDGIPVEMTFEKRGSDESEHWGWRGDVLLAVIGNAFRVPGLSRPEQPSAIDGLLEVIVLEELPPITATESAIDTLLDNGMMPISRHESSSLRIKNLDGEPLTFSLDGELLSATEIDIDVEKQLLSLYADVSG